MENCIFCKIVKKEVSASIVYEDDKSIAFLDIHPYNHGHTLIVPKTHAKNFFETEDNDLSHLILISKKIGAAIEKAIDADGLQIRINIREAGGQDVFHTHIHVIPKFKGDETRNHHIGYKDTEKEETAKKIIEALQSQEESH